MYEHRLANAKDTQFELVDALLSHSLIRSFPELSQSVVFRRKWPSVYEALRKGKQKREWLERFFISLVPSTGAKNFSLDGTAWVHSQAKCLQDLQYVYSPTPAIDEGNIVIGHPYSVLAWVPEKRRSWVQPVTIRRTKSSQIEVEIGVQQVKLLCKEQQKEMKQEFHLIAADGKYGNHRFLGPLKNELCSLVARLRRDRVLYDNPGPYCGRGRPRVYGTRFAFKEPETWSKANADVKLEGEQWGTVHLQRWDQLHARLDAQTPFSVLLVEVHLERDKPPKGLWLAYQLPAGQSPDAQQVKDIWYGYQYRWPVEPSIRFRKQYLNWILPRFQNSERCDLWTMLVSIAQWQLFLAQKLVQDNPSKKNPRRSVFCKG